MARQIPVVLTDTNTIFQTNFSGVVRSTYDREGVRKFSVIINNEDVLNILLNEGWNVRQTKPDEDGNFVYFIDIFVSYKVKVPIIKMVVGNTMTDLTEETVHLLDGSRITSVNVAFVGSRWFDPSGSRSGIKAYLEEGIFEIMPSPLAGVYERYNG